MIFINGIEEILSQSIFKLRCKDETVHGCQIVRFEYLIYFMHLLPEFFLLIRLWIFVGYKGQSFADLTTVASHNKNKIV